MTDPLRVAHLTTVDLSLRYLVLPQLLAVRDAGGEAVGISAPGPFVNELEELGIRHVPLRSSTRGMNLVADVRSAIQLWQILRSEQFDVLHTHNPKPGIYGRILGRLAGVPVVVNTVHGLYATPDDPWLKRLIVYGLEAIAARFSDRELVQSREDYELLTRLRITRPARTHHLGNGVDLSRFDPGRFTKEDRARIRAELGATPGDIVIGSVGRLVEEKGYLDLFDAATSLGPNYLVACIGPDDPEKADALDRDAITEAEKNGVRFLGMRTDVDQLLAGLDVFVLPSHREGFPRAAMEAASMGLPVVATDVRGCREVVDHGVNGLLVPVREPTALAEAIQRLGKNQELREAMGRAGKQIARERFDERRVVEKVMRSYQMSKGNDRRSGRPVAAAIKRALDLAVAASGLVVLSPVLAAIALAVRIRLGRPVLFRQIRPGLNGLPFTIYKFRTMTTAHDDSGAPLADAERLTRFGSWLRRTSLDELPELWNVLRGEMSLVGPRPLLMEYLDLYDADQHRRHEMRPGLTGWAQINGRNAADWEERLQNDVWYVDNWSVGLDLRIMAETVRLVVSGRGVNQQGRATVDRFPGKGE